MRILVLPRYDRLGASSRLRMMQYLPWLMSTGIELTVSPLFSDSYVSDLQRSRRKLGNVVKAYAGRLNILLHTGSFDLIWIEKECLPWLPACIEQTFIHSRVPYVLDYDDAVFHYYDQHSNPLLKYLLGGKHQALIRGSALVVAGNTYLAEFARQAGAAQVEVVPTVIDLDRYPVASRGLAGFDVAPPCIGWIGQRATASFLMPYRPIFEHMSVTGKARFAAIGIDAQSLGLPMNSIAWSEETEVASISSFDVGIMPLVDEPFERGKCGYKLIQYMACGLPVVASPVGVNCQIVEHGVNGFLAETPHQWEQALTILLADKGLRERMGQAGRQKVEREYCIQSTAPRMAALLKTSASTTRKDN